MELLAEIDRLPLGREDRQIALAQIAPKADVEIFGSNVEGTLQYLLDSSREIRPVFEDEIPDGVFPPFRFDEVEDRVAESVGEIALDPVLGDLGNLIGHDGVAQVLFRAVAFVVSIVGGEALEEPLRHVRGGRLDEISLEEDLELEDVRQLVLNQLLERFLGQIDREDHAVARRQRERPDAFRDEVQVGVRLFELRMGGVEDQRYRMRDLEIEASRELVVGTLRKRRDLLERVFFRLIEIDLKVRRAVDRPVELVVDDLVLPELRTDVSREKRGRQHHQNPQGEDRGLFHHVTL